MSKSIPPTALFIVRMIGLVCFAVAGFLTVAIFWANFNACIAGAVLACCVGGNWLWRH